MRVRILLASDYYPPSIGGAQVQTQLLARAFRSRGHEVAVATAWQSNAPGIEDDDGISIHRLRQVRTIPIPGLSRSRSLHHQPPFPDPVTAFSLRRLIGRFNPDLVHSYGWMSYSVAAALIGSRIPMLITARDYGYSCANRTLMRDGEECDGPGLLKCVGCAGRNYGRPKGWVAALGVNFSSPLLRRKVSGVHSVSSYVRSIVRRDFLDEDSASSSGHVIHDVIGSVSDSGPDAAAAAEEPGHLPSEPFILFVGAFRKIKGVPGASGCVSTARSRAAARDDRNHRARLADRVPARSAACPRSAARGGPGNGVLAPMSLRESCPHVSLSPSGTAVCEVKE